ncbi:DUF1177 domain-containing protein [Metallosphaera tengchongensis]|uniref:DUF1177 domain-containing protein n=1 Tax=Metallosphaera tengchongensis TaxID=1532350 RepID=A0A6N0NTK9_9CREN|nr:DUF1177 domain-containing protein [Metallosphaera tengchongensis]QKR00204.1 DUF1177 domain-containing protein [Metallosphaera tengchongensis]
MMFKTLMEVLEILESADPMDQIKSMLKGKILLREINVEDVPFLKAVYGGGKERVRVIGRLGAIQMRKVNKGLVSDADGAVVSLALLMELVKLMEKGIKLDVEVSIVTNLSTDAKLVPHKPFDFMVPPVGLDDALKIEVDEETSLVLSVDSTKGNKIAKYDDFALTHVVKDGYIMKLDDDVINIYNKVTGHEIFLVPLTTGDLTPLDYKVYHISTLVSPWLYTHSPVIGVATVSREVIPGYETGVLDITMLEHASRFCLELLKFVEKGGKVYDQKEFEELKERLGESNLRKIQRIG